MEEKKNKINKTKISVVLGIMCFALALGICIQIRTVKNSNSTVSSNYEENNLRAEVLKYKEKYDNKYKELEKAEEELEKERQNSTKDNSQLEEKEEQIKQGNKMIGLTEVTGPGVIVTLSDSKKDANSVLNPSTLLVHDVDILGVVNELKKAIGLPEQLAGLSRPGGYLEILKGASVGVELKKSNNITISKYTGVINYQYAQTVK